MTFPRSADDRPDPADQHAVHARVPEHVSRGVFSTGVIVMTAPTEFVIDFIQNLGRPHQVVARVIMPHPVLPQFVDALLKNIELYRGRYGNLPQPNVTSVVMTHAAGPVVAPGAGGAHAPAPAFNQPGSTQPGSTQPRPGEPSHSGQQPNWPSGARPLEGPGSISDAYVVPPNEVTAASHPAGSSSIVGAGLGGMEQDTAAQDSSAHSNPAQGNPDHADSEDSAAWQAAANSPGSAHHGAPPPASHRRASAQEIYDDLKMRDEIHSGSYANAVMIGHGPHEFSFDFITNFYPQSAVSARVFLAAGQVARLAESLRGAWDQIRHRFQPPPGGENPPRH